jgi:hypothetical protein
MRSAVAALALVAASPAPAVEVRSPDGELLAFPTLLDDEGTPIATSSMRQWFERGRLHVRIEHSLRDGRRAVERATFTQGRKLEQHAWSWEERRGGETVRAFAVDLDAGRATGRKRDGKDEDGWDEEVKVEKGRTFVGLGVTYAVKNLRDEVVGGHEVKLRTIAFLPRPVSIAIVVKHGGRERIVVGGRKVDSDRLEVRPDLKGLEELLEKLKDPAGADVWLHHGVPPMILRIRYPLAEARDPVVVLETLGSPRSAKAAGRAGAPARGQR